MGSSVIRLDNIRDMKIKSYTISELILNSVKRKESQNYYIEQYQETDEERDIFSVWNDRRKKRNDE